MNILIDWMKGKLMKYHISDKEYDMIQNAGGEQKQFVVLLRDHDIVSDCYAFNFFFFSFVCKISISLHTTDACRCAHIGRFVYKQK